jgi:two-component system, cell cycle sensor histidine kinase and response regulator CckA
MAIEPKRILVVDDELHNLDLLEAILDTFGYESEFAADGFEAIAKMSPRIDLVLLDVMMPRMDGFEVLRRLRKDPQCFDTPVIMITSLSGKTERLYAAECGANDFISKPIDRLELSVRMKSLLKMKEAQDAIKRHRAELEIMVEKRTEALIQSEQTYRALFENSLDPILMVDRQGKIADINRAFEELFGYTRQEILTMHVRSLYADPADGNRIKEEILRQGFVRDSELRVRTRDGMERDCVLTSWTRRGASEEVLGYQSLIRDITDRKKAHEALRRSEARTRLLIEASPIGIMIALDGSYSDVNPAFLHMFGYESQDQIVGRPVEVLCSEDDRPLFVETMRRALHEKESVQSVRVKGLKHNGQSLEASVWLRCTDLGGAPALLGFLVDVSQEKVLREQLLQAQKLEALGTLAGGIAHDFNNILFAMMGFTELALDECSDGSMVHANLEQVLIGGNRAKDLVRQILTFSRQADEVRQPIHIGPIFKETLKFLRASLPATVKIQHNIGSELGPILAHPTQIHQVLMNLCTNAAHAMRENGGKLTVTLDEAEFSSDTGLPPAGLATGRYLKLAVRDTGQGMSPDITERIFEPYFTTKKAGEGSGLGLAVVHGIVESHGGMIEVETEVQQGTTFRVYFPVIDEEAPAGEREGDSIPRGRESILLVDDEDLVVRACKKMLENLGYQVVGETNSLEALGRFRKTPDQFDLVITDMTMPNLTGVGLTLELKSIRPDIPVVVCTGFSDQLSPEVIDEMGIAALVMKPVLKGKLARTVRRVLDRT